MKSGMVIEYIAYVLLAGIFLSALWVCSLFFGDPVSKFIAGKNVRSYLAENYPDNHFRIKSLDYDFKIGGYSAKVFSETDPGVEFVIRARNKGVMYDQYKQEYIRDREMEIRFTEQIERMLFPAIKAKVPELTGINTEIYIKKGKYNINADYSKDIDEQLKVFADINGSGTEKLSREGFLEKALQIRNIITDSGFKMEYFHCYYFFKQKGDGYSLELKRDEINLPGDKLINSDRLTDYGQLNRDKRRG
ncbi:MAG: hypothetical protein ACOY31_11225 [Bacillota bacterium]